MTGTNGLKTEFFGLTVMTAEFQKLLDYISIGPKNAYCFLDDNLIVGRGSEENRKQHVVNSLKRLDEEHFRINLTESHFVKF